MLEAARRARSTLLRRRRAALIGIERIHTTTCACDVAVPNGEVQQRGRLQRLHTSESRQAGPVCCNGWFGAARLSHHAERSEPACAGRRRTATPCRVKKVIQTDTDTNSHPSW